MNPNLLDLFLKQTYTKTDALRRVRVINQFLEQKLFNGKQDVLATLSTYDLAWIKSLPPEFFNSFTKDNLASQIEQFNTIIGKSLALTIYVPFELPDDEKMPLSEKLRSNYGKNFLFDLKLNPLLIGGCALAWKGIFRDYSLKKRIDDDRQRILSVLKEYIK